MLEKYVNNISKIRFDHKLLGYFIKKHGMYTLLCLSSELFLY